MLFPAEVVLHREELSAALATLPFWPLLGTLIIGITLMLRRGQAIAPAAIILGVGASAALAFLAFFSMRTAPAAQESRAPAAAIVHVAQHAHPVSATAEQPGHATPVAAATTHGEPHAGGPQVIRYATRTLFHWISLGLLSNGATRWIDVNFFVDGLTRVMLIVVTLISLMVMIYSVDYMKDHHGHKLAGYERFFAWLGLFVFSMCMLVMAGNFVLLYLGWEAVGLCSYLLIGFYYGKPEAADAAKKAFLVNRIGDFGFALGIFAIYYFLSPIVAPGENPLDYETVFKYAPRLADMSLWGVSAPTLIGLLLLCGALGKSAQFPIYVWLPDAMEGPTPVSALIHAATMVTAGVYMIARLGPIYAMSPAALEVVMWVGLIGAVLAATMAMAQYDMKRILAYSTMSQLAFMFVALGCAAPQAAIFHLYTHAFFKALLFLTAGNVMHAMGNIIDIRYFSGLRRMLPTTYRLMLIGCLALAGFPLLAGFWSKDEIVHAAVVHRPWVGVVLLATAAMTAYYTFRMFLMCFHGPERLPPEAGEHPHDATPLMVTSLIPLAIGAVFAGYVGVSLAPSLSDSFLGYFSPHGFYHDYIADSSMVLPAQHGGGAIWMYVSGLIAIAAMALAYVRYGEAPQDEPDQRALGPLWNLWNAKYFVDEIYQALFVRPLRRLGDLFFATDNHGVDGLVNWIGRVPMFAGAAIRTLQRGAVQGYALGTVLGLGLMMLILRWLTPAP